MAKHTVEQSPKLDYLAPNFSEIYPYLSQWGIVDDKGRYLPWCKLKWRVPSKEAKNICWAIKFRREQVKKNIGVFDKHGNEYFSSNKNWKVNALHSSSRHKR